MHHNSDPHLLFHTNTDKKSHVRVHNYQDLCVVLIKRVTCAYFFSIVDLCFVNDL